MTEPPFAVAAQRDPTRPTYFPQLEGLRGVLASFVVLHHAMLQVWPDPETRPRLAAPLSPGRLAVDGFIVLSGVVLGAAVVQDGGFRRGVVGFYWGRVRRIVPPYLAALALSLGLILTLIGRPTGTHWDISTRWTWTGLVAALTLTGDWFGRSEINHVFWSVAVESKVYLLFPPLVWLWRRIGLGTTTALVLALVVGASLGLRGEDGELPRFWADACPWYLVLFLLGVGTAVVALADTPVCGRLRRLPLGGLTALLLVLVGVGAARFGVRRFYQVALVSDLAVGAVAALGLTAIIARPGWVASLLRSRATVAVGTISYSLYLIHAPLLQVVHQYLLFPLRLTRAGQFAGLLGIGGPLILATSWVFFRVCERPFLSRRRREAELQELRPREAGDRP